MWTPPKMTTPTPEQVQDARSTLLDHFTSQLADLLAEVGVESEEATALAVILREMVTTDQELGGAIISGLSGDKTVAHAAVIAAIEHARWTYFDRTHTSHGC